MCLCFTQWNVTRSALQQLHVYHSPVPVPVGTLHKPSRLKQKAQKRTHVDAMTSTSILSGRPWRRTASATPPPRHSLATENLLENTDGVLHQCYLGAAACYLLFMLTRAILMPSLFYRPAYCKELHFFDQQYTTVTRRAQGQWKTGHARYSPNPLARSQNSACLCTIQYADVRPW